MRGENLREGKKAEGLNYSFKLKNKLIELKTSWKSHHKLYLPIQKHTSRVLTLTSFPYPPTIGDAVITNLKGIEIGVRTADCVPLILIGEEWVGVAHVGWRGLASGILEKLIEKIGKHEDVKNLFAFLGPSAKACCYEVGEEFRNLFPRYILERGGNLYMDMQNSVAQELKALGVQSIGMYERCTVCSEDLPSYRRDRSEERILSSVRIL